MTRNNSCAHETIFRLQRRIPETADGYQATNAWQRKRARHKLENVKMRTVGLALALAVVLLPSMAGSLQSNLPGVGTFSYNGTPLATPASLVVAVR